MKYIYVLMPTFLFMSYAFVACAQISHVQGDHKSAFASILEVESNDFAVPTVVDVPVTFMHHMQRMIMVVDDDDNIIPSIIVSRVIDEPIIFHARDSYESVAIHNITDGSRETFVEFPFEEGIVRDERMISVTDDHDQESRFGERTVEQSSDNIVTIDLFANRMFTSDTMHVRFDDHIAKPTHIRIVSVDENDNERILVPERFYTNDVVTFPRATTDHYRVTFAYNMPLRISEITFDEQDIPQTTEQLARFIARPQMAYTIYFNAPDPIDLPQQEIPQLSTASNTAYVAHVEMKNPLYKRSDRDGDGVMDSIDNCIDVSNADQQDLDHNGVGDACEDFDRDGIMNAHDNCVNVANRSQADEDHDGIGDACDGEESRMMEKYPWIPYIVLFSVFVVVSLIIVKTFKK